MGQRKPLWEELGGLAYRSAQDMGGEEQSGLKVQKWHTMRRLYPNGQKRGPEKRRGCPFDLRSGFLPLDATSLHFQHPRGPPEAAAPPASRSGPKIEKRPTDTLSTGGTGGAPGAAPERLCAKVIPRTALFRPVAAVLAL